MRLKINYNNMMKSALIPDGFTAEEIKILPMESAFASLKAMRSQLKRQGLAARPTEDAAYIL